MFMFGVYRSTTMTQKIMVIKNISSNLLYIYIYVIYRNMNTVEGSNNIFKNDNNHTTQQKLMI